MCIASKFVEKFDDENQWSWSDVSDDEPDGPIAEYLVRRAAMVASASRYDAAIEWLEARTRLRTRLRNCTCSNVQECSARLVATYIKLIFRNSDDFALMVEKVPPTPAEAAAVIAAGNDLDDVGEVTNEAHARYIRVNYSARNRTLLMSIAQGAHASADYSPS